MNFEPDPFPSFEERALRSANKCHATLNRAQWGRSHVLLQQAVDLPGRAESKVALYLLNRRGHLSSKEGKDNRVLR